MSAEIDTFIKKLDNFSKNLYISNDNDKLKQELIEINNLYDKLMQSKNMNDMTKNYILHGFNKYESIYLLAPIYHKMLHSIRNRYNQYYCVELNNDSLGPM
jgi:hypothetical protein